MLDIVYATKKFNTFIIYGKTEENKIKVTNST